MSTVRTLAQIAEQAVHTALNSAVAQYTITALDEHPECYGETIRAYIAAIRTELALWEHAERAVYGPKPRPSHMRLAVDNT
jgi:hypothetical protein